MGQNNKFFDDFAKVATGGLGGFLGIKSQLKEIIRQKIEEYISSLNLVTREEYDLVKSLATNARQDQQKLELKIKELEQKLSEKTASKPKSKKAF